MNKFKIYYEGVDGIVRFDERPLFYDSNTLFDYSHGFDLLDLPSGTSSRIKRITSFATTYDLDLQVVGADKGEIQNKLHNRFQNDVDNYIKTGKLAKLWVNDTYIECLLSAKSHTKWNALDMYERITLQVIAPKSKWIHEQEFSHVRMDIEIDEFANNLIKPPYDFSQFEFPEGTQPLEDYLNEDIDLDDINFAESPSPAVIDNDFMEWKTDKAEVNFEVIDGEYVGDGCYTKEGYGTPAILTESVKVRGDFSLRGTLENLSENDLMVAVVYNVVYSDDKESDKFYDFIYFGPRYSVTLDGKYDKTAAHHSGGVISEVYFQVQGFHNVKFCNVMLKEKEANITLEHNQTVDEWLTDEATRIKVESANGEYIKLHSPVYRIPLKPIKFSNDLVFEEDLFFGEGTKNAYVRSYIFIRNNTNITLSLYDRGREIATILGGATREITFTSRDEVQLELRSFHDKLDVTMYNYMLTEDSVRKTVTQKKKIEDGLRVKTFFSNHANVTTYEKKIGKKGVNYRVTGVVESYNDAGISLGTNIDVVNPVIEQGLNSIDITGEMTSDDLWLSLYKRDPNEDVDLLIKDFNIKVTEGLYGGVEYYNTRYRVQLKGQANDKWFAYNVEEEVFEGNLLTHTLDVQNIGDSVVEFRSDKGFYLDNPTDYVNVGENRVAKFTGIAENSSDIIPFVISSKGDLDVVINKPAVTFGEDAFVWQTNAYPLRIPTLIPFYITSDSTQQYIDNDNEVADVYSLITIYGPVDKPTLTIGDNVYKMHSELLEGERLEIDQRNKTIYKITKSGDRINIFNERDKEDSVFKPLPSGNNIVTQNTEFSYSIIMFHERNEPLWT